MAPPARGRSLAKSAFPSTFHKLKTSTYYDNPRPAVPVSQSHYIRTLSWNAQGTLIATGAPDRTLRIWNPEKTNVKNSTELRGHQGAVERVAFHPINETELASCSSDGLVKFWDVRSKASVGEVRVGGEPFMLSWKPDGTEIVAGRKDNILVPIDRTALKVIAEHPQIVQTNQSTFDWVGSHLYVTNGEGCVKILDYPSFEPVLTLTAHTSSCYAISMSPSGEYLAVGGSDALVTLWDTQEWICPRTLDVDGAVKSVDFSFDGSYLVAGTDEEKKKLQIAHVESGEYIHTVDLTAPAVSVAWHPCRYVLAYSADAQGLKIIDLRRSLAQIQRPYGVVALSRLWNGKIPNNIVFRYAVAPFNPASLFSAKGLVVVITGGGSGLGLAIASALHQNGASKIYLLGRRSETLENAVKTLESSPSAPKDSPGAVVGVQCDVTSPESIGAAVSKITSDTGYVDVLINNAGVIGPANGADLYKAETIKDLQTAMLKDWDRWESTMAINTSSIVGVSGAFLPLLEAANVRRGWQTGKVSGYEIARRQDTSALSKIGADPDDDRLAHIITVASIASFMRHCTAGLAYNASKAGAAHLGKMMSTLFAEWGIRSNVVCPGPYPSEMTAGGKKVFGPDEVPQGRPGGGNDITGLALFLVGKAGSYVNGSVQLTDGGRIGVFPSVY
ncbi:WD40-repeat-containing domain protein [Clohesyomyces aquaticus]|uniref:WD40-repeat-containing domain protein n=1 Tax=Clohesyomyces aquaticus TaxID=1231657 RepID=A0A1Y1ZVC2_9PLEO|nr:WD40-repeat-containing domain protein [Clohesyomyces aquaticus]